MRNTGITKTPNKKLLSLLERADRLAGPSSVQEDSLGNAHASAGAVAPNGSALASAGGATGAGIGFNDRQKREALLVDKLPDDFPIEKWESLSTKAQLKAMQFSGLNDQDQWVLLNATAPLQVLQQYNQEQDEIARTEYANNVAVTLAKQILSASIPRAKASVTPTRVPASTPTLAPLKSNGWQQSLDKLHEIKIIPGQASAFTGAAVAPKATGLGTVAGGVGSEITNPAKRRPDSTPTNTPQLFTFETEQPSSTPIITPTPDPTPSLTPTPELSERQILANEGVDFVIGVLGAPYSNKGRYGVEGYDCSGLVIAMCDAMESKLPFDGVHIKKTCKYGMAESLLSDSSYASKLYSYIDGGIIGDLQAGDLIFYANPDKMNQDAHVAIATGEMMYDSETEAYWPEVVEASGYSKDVTNKYPAYNIQEDGEYVREHTGQVVTYVIRPKYDWEEQP